MLSQSITHKKELPTLLWGFVISFLGSLPPGTTNVLEIQLAAMKGYHVAIWFSAGCMIAEIICVSVCVIVMDRISRSKVFIKILEWVSLLVIVWIVVSSFATIRDPAVTDMPEIPGRLSPFVFGLFLMMINPVQMPFWFGWTTILVERNILRPTSRDNVPYIIGIGIGSIAASAIFIAGGHMITDWVAGREKLIQWVFGILFLIIALIQIWKIFRRPADQAQGL